MTVTDTNTKAELIETAMLHRYAGKEKHLGLHSGNNVSSSDLVSILWSLKSVVEEDQPSDLISRISFDHPHIAISPTDFRLLALIDECIADFMHVSQIDSRLEMVIHKVTPILAASVLENGWQQLLKQQHSYKILDLMCIMVFYLICTVSKIIRIV